MTNEEKAQEIAENLYKKWGDSAYATGAEYGANEMAQWKDEQFAKEKQQLIQEYEGKLNKLNQREEIIRDNVRRVNSRYGFEGLF